MGEPAGVDPAAAVVWEDLVPFGARSVRLTAGGWPFFRLALPAPGDAGPAPARAALLLRPAAVGFALVAVGLDADGSVRVERSAAAPAGPDWEAAWRLFAGLRTDRDRLRAWLAANAAVLAVLGAGEGRATSTGPG